MVDPSAYTPPYDHALCAALAQAGAEVTLVTSRFAYGQAPAPEGYVRRELFYRVALGPAGSRARTAMKLVEHVPDMLRYRRFARAADVVHFQWLPVQHVDVRLLPGARRRGRRGRGHWRDRGGAHGPPLVITAHDILPREPRPGQLAAQRRLYERFDAIVVHSEHGRARLTDELGVDGARVHVIPHGVLAPSRQTLTHRQQLPDPLRRSPEDRPVALMLGLLRPYKGLDLLLEAWRGIEDAELWVAGLPKFDILPLRDTAPANVQFLTRFVSEEEIDTLMRRADLVVLPYREADQSGVAFTALGAGVPLLLSDVGGFPELAATGAARTFPAGDAAALHTALAELLAGPAIRAAMSERAGAAAEGPYSWQKIALQTLGLYDSLLGKGANR